MAEPKYRNVKWRSGEEAEIMDCPLRKTVSGHIGCPWFGGMRDKEGRQQVIPQQYLGAGHVKRITNVGCFHPGVQRVAVVKDEQSAMPPRVDTDDVGKAVAVNGVVLSPEVEKVGPQPGDGTSELLTMPKVVTDDVGNPIPQARPAPVVQEGVATCRCGPDTWCNVCKGKMGKPDGSGKATPVADPPPQMPEIELDVSGVSESEDARRAAKAGGVESQSDEELEAVVSEAPPEQSEKEKALASQIKSAKKGKKGKKKGA